MQRHIASLFILVISMLLFGCSRGPDALPQAAADTWERAFNDNDLNTLMASYSDDAQLLPPGQPVRAGKAAIRGFFDGSLGVLQIKGKSTQWESHVSGDTAYRVGAYRIMGIDGNSLEVGKFVEIWRLQDGQWKLHRNIWNLDARSGTDTQVDVEPAT
ncbi:MAG: DUF4440 domain-containing protein [Steroidobacteraceae bacterium]